MSIAAGTLAGPRAAGASVVALADVGAADAAAWAGLARDGALNPSLLPGWRQAALDSHGLTGRTRVLLSRRAGALTGAVPYLIESTRVLGMPATRLSLGSNVVSYHAELVTRDAHDELLAALLAAEPGWSVLHVANLLPDGPTALALRRLAAARRAPLLAYPVDFAPYLPITGSFDDLLAGKGKKFRYKYRKRQESLAGNGLSMRWFADASAVAEFYAAMLAIEARSWKASDQVAVDATATEGRYYAALLPWLAGEGALLANVLYQNGEPVAYNLCCHAHGWVGQLKTSFAISAEALSPGALVIDAAIRKAFDLGAREFDFLGTPGKAAPEPHKLFWTDCVRRHWDFFLFAPRPVWRLVAGAKALKQRWAARAATSGVSAPDEGE